MFLNCDLKYYVFWIFSKCFWIVTFILSIWQASSMAVRAVQVAISDSLRQVRQLGIEASEASGNWDNCVLGIMCTTAHVIYGEKYKCPKWTNTNPTYHTIQYRPIFSEIKWHMEILLYRCENGKGWSMTGCHMEISPMRCGLGKGWSMSETVARRSPAKPPFRPNPPTIGDQHHKWSTNFDFISQEKINELSASPLTWVLKAHPISRKKLKGSVLAIFFFVVT